MMPARTARIALCLSLVSQTLAAQDKEVPPKPDPKPIGVAPPGVVALPVRLPLEMENIRFFVQIPEAGGGTRASTDGRYVALNRPSVMVAMRNRSGERVIMRGSANARLYRGRPPATTVASVSAAPRTPTVQQMFDNMSRYVDLPYSARIRLTGNLPIDGYEEYYGRLENNLDSLATMRYQRATWSPRTTLVAETGVLYTLRVDVAHEGDGMTRHYRGDYTFRYDSNGKMIGVRITYPPAPAPTTGRPSVEVRR